METVEYTLLSHVHGKMDIRSLSHGMGNIKYAIARIRVQDILARRHQLLMP